MKIVINTCYGGFGLSLLAQQRYLELNGKKAHFYKYNYKTDKYKKIHNSISKELLFIQCFTQNYGNNFSEYPKEQTEFFQSKIPRNDQKLIQVIKEFGTKANGNFAQLDIVEIPDDVDWEIEEYDGKEWVAERHRVWN